MSVSTAKLTEEKYFTVPCKGCNRDHSHKYFLISGLLQCECGQLIGGQDIADRIDQLEKEQDENVWQQTRETLGLIEKQETRK